MSLNPCSQCGTHPVEQTRGEMTPEDHHMQHLRIEPAKQARKFGIMVDVDDLVRDAYQVENQGSDHNNDMRISCPTCGNATGWDRRDIEEFKEWPGNPGHAERRIKVPHGNVDNIRKRWNDANPVK